MYSKTSRTNSRYNRRYRKKYGSKYQNRSYSKVPTNRSLNRKIKKIQHLMELKYKDTEFLGVIPANGQLLLLNGVIQATAANRRVGDQITLTSFQIRGQAYSTTAAIYPTTLRMIVFYDRQSNGEPPSIVTTSTDQTGLLEKTTGLTDNVLLPFNFSAKERYRIISDRRIVLNSNYIGTNGNPANNGYSIDLFKKTSRTVKYDGQTNTGVIDNILTNALWVLFISDEVSDDLPYVAMSTRIYYKDA